MLVRNWKAEEGKVQRNEARSTWLRYECSSTSNMEVKISCLKEKIMVWGGCWTLLDLALDLL
jgi:hypothetical protein